MCNNTKHFFSWREGPGNNGTKQLHLMATFNLWQRPTLTIKYHVKGGSIWQGGKAGGRCLPSNVKSGKQVLRLVSSMHLKSFLSLNPHRRMLLEHHLVQSIEALHHAFETPKKSYLWSWTLIMGQRNILIHQPNVTSITFGIVGLTYACMCTVNLTQAMHTCIQ